MTPEEKEKAKQKAIEALAEKIYIGRISELSFLKSDDLPSRKRKVRDEAVSSLGAAAIFYEERQNRRKREALKRQKQQENEVQDESPS